MIKYPKTQQFRNIIHQIRTQHDYQGLDAEGNAIINHTSPYPVMTFDATVKLHGTNAAIVFHADGTTTYQSRERELSLTSDNAGFMQAMTNKNLDWLRMEAFAWGPCEKEVVLFGEWCGGNIQKGVALSQLPEKIFVVFQVLVDGEPADTEWTVSDPTQGIYSIYDFPNWEITIDFNNPIAAQNEIVRITQEVEDQCPVGKAFGIDGIGEGIVLRAQNDPTIFFKSKGEKHSVSNVKTLAAVDPEKLKNVSEFVEYAVTENRLNQGLENFSLENKNIGPFIQWVVKDIAEEENDVLFNSQLTIKDVGRQISEKAKEFFFTKMNQL